MSLTNTINIDIKDLEFPEGIYTTKSLCNLFVLKMCDGYNLR